MSSKSLGKNLLLPLLLTFTFVLVFVHHIHFRPKGSSLPVFAGFNFLDFFPAFFLSVALDLAKVAEFAISVGIVAVEFCVCLI